MWNICLSPQEDDPQAVQSTTKVGTIDDTIILDRPRWLGVFVGAYFGKLKPMDLLFPDAAGRVVPAFKSACAALGLPPLCLYQLRHGGASEDILSKDREYLEVKARGRWCTDVSLRRYAKPAQLRRLMGELSPAARIYCERALKNLEDMVTLFF